MFYDATYKHGSVHTAREMLPNKSIYMCKSQTKKTEAMLTAIATGVLYLDVIS